MQDLEILTYSKNVTFTYLVYQMDEWATQKKIHVESTQITRTKGYIVFKIFLRALCHFFPECVSMSYESKNFPHI